MSELVNMTVNSQWEIEWNRAVESMADWQGACDIIQLLVVVVVVVSRVQQYHIAIVKGIDSGVVGAGSAVVMATNALLPTRATNATSAQTQASLTFADTHKQLTDQTVNSDYKSNSRRRRRRRRRKGDNNHRIAQSERTDWLSAGSVGQQSTTTSSTSTTSTNQSYVCNAVTLSHSFSAANCCSFAPSADKRCTCDVA